MNDRFDDVLGSGRGADAQPRQPQPPSSIEVVRRFANDLLGCTLGHSELRSRAHRAGVFAFRGTLRTSKGRERAVVIVSAFGVLHTDAPTPLAMLLLDLSPSGHVTRSVVLRNDSVHIV